MPVHFGAYVKYREGTIRVLDNKHMSTWSTDMFYTVQALTVS